jgi:hypothetical protein
LDALSNKRIMKKLFIILALLIASCASRKVAIVKEDVKTTIDSVAIVKVDGTYTKQTNLFINETIDEVEYKPADTSKPMFVNGIKYFNTIIKSKKTKKSTVDTTNVKSVIKIDNKDTVKKEEKKISLNKKIDKKASYFVYLWLLLIPAIIYIYKRVVRYSLI